MFRCLFPLARSPSLSGFRFWAVLSASPQAPGFPPTSPTQTAVTSVSASGLRPSFVTRSERLPPLLPAPPRTAAGSCFLRRGPGTSWFSLPLAASIRSARPRSGSLPAASPPESLGRRCALCGSAAERRVVPGPRGLPRPGFRAPAGRQELPLRVVALVRLLCHRPISLETPS